MPSYVLDTSALLTVLNDEEGADTVLRIVAVKGQKKQSSRNSTVHLPFMALMELHYLLIRKNGQAEAQKVIRMIKVWPVQLNESTRLWREEAARIKATTRLSVADAWICGLARLLDAQLVHKDPEYDTVKNLASLRLPYKTR
ncbi:PIN domain-containing protein [Acidobacteria bacterium AH-259-G07]|nr:PIN domain-containing protein [Acidobacteria bacterium AH-259-L09]MDA2926769.1 PIN domain-containing protein [Acidobacteria bacterium AH-259-G07]